MLPSEPYEPLSLSTDGQGLRTSTNTGISHCGTVTLKQLKLGAAVAIVGVTILIVVLINSTAPSAPAVTPGPSSLPHADLCKTAPLAWPCAPALESTSAAHPLAQFRRVMVITAHPDDESMAGGLLAELHAAVC